MSGAPAPHPQFSVAIIAGGQSRRMGRDKAWLKLGGMSLVERVIQASADLNQAQTILITNSPADYAHLGLPMYGDALPGKGALGGIYTALLRAKSDYALTLACDMPFVSAKLLRFMLSQLDESVDIVVPRVDGYPQAMHAIYRKTCLAPIRRQLEAKRLKIIRFFADVRVRYLDEADYAPYDSDGRSFANLNTPDELEEARRWLRTSDDRGAD